MCDPNVCQVAQKKIQFLVSKKRIELEQKLVKKRLKETKKNFLKKLLKRNF